MANANNIYTRTFKLTFANVLTLQPPNGEYAQSGAFNMKGPYGQDVKFALRLFPRGKRGNSKNNVSIFLHLLDGNGSNYVKADWKLSIINAKGNNVNEHEVKSFIFDAAENDKGCGFDNFITRSNLANANRDYIVEGHKLILQFEISIKTEKDLKSELLKKNEETKNLKRKLDSKEEEFKKLRTDYQQYQQLYREKIEILEKDNSAAIEKFQEEEEERYLKLGIEYELLLNSHGEKIAKLEKDKLDAVEKCRKEEETRHSNLHSEYEQQLKLQMKRYRENVLNVEKNASEKLKKLQGKYDKLSNYVRNSSKMIEEIENDDELEASSTSSYTSA